MFGNYYGIISNVGGFFSNCFDVCLNSLKCFDFCWNYFEFSGMFEWRKNCAEEQPS